MTSNLVSTCRGDLFVLVVTAVCPGSALTTPKEEARGEITLFVFDSLLRASEFLN